MLNSHTLINSNSYKFLNVLRIIQICDSNFPIGSFNHSFGMESYLRNNKIINSDTMRKWLDSFLKSQFIYSDGLAIRMIYEYLEKENLDMIWNLDRVLTVQSIAKETRNANKLIASRMTKLFLDLYESELLELYEEKILKKEVFGHPAIAFALLMYTLDFTKEEAIIFHMYSTISTLIQNAVRAIPLGQKDGQLILKDFCEKFKYFYEEIESMDYSYLGANTPGLELSQINHEILEFRLFMS